MRRFAGIARRLFCRTAEEHVRRALVAAEMKRGQA